MSNISFFVKSISIGIMLVASVVASMSIYSLTEDRIKNQQTALETSGGNKAEVKIFNKIPGFENESGLSVYRKVERVLKYAILFIVLTFGAFFLMDVLGQLRLHPIQYLLVGLGLAEFYLLLLALTEHLGFMTAYITSAVMTISLLTMYSYFILHTKKGAVTIASLLTLIYSYLLIVLNLETYALLTGAFLLFAILAFVMIITRNINWNQAFQFEVK